MSNYRLTRGGLKNFFRFHDEEFDFKNKFTIFSGENAAGKTTSMTVLMPNLLTMDEKRSINIDDGKVRDFGEYLKINSSSFIWGQFESDDNIQLLVIAYDKGENNTIIKTGMIFNPGVSVDKVSFYRSDESLYSRNDFKTINKELISSTFSNSRERDYRREINKLFYGFEDVKQFEKLMELGIGLTKAISEKSGSLTIEKFKTTLMDYLVDAKSDGDIYDGINSFVKAVKSEYETKKELDIISQNIEKNNTVNECITKLNKPYLDNIFKNSSSIDEKASLTYEKLKSNQEAQSDVQNELVGIRKETKDLAEEIKTLTKKRVNIDLEMTALSDQKKEQEKSFEQINKKIKDLESSINKHKSSYDENNKKIKSIKNDISARSNECKGIKSGSPYFAEDVDMKKTAAEIKTQKKIISEIENKSIELNLKKNTLQNDNQHLQEKLLLKRKIEDELKTLEEKYVLDFTKWINDFGIDISTEDVNIDNLIDTDNFIDNKREKQEQYNENKLSLKGSVMSLEQKEKDISVSIKELSLSKKPYSPNKFSEGHELYELIDFKSDIPESIKLKLEASLKETGLLYTIFNAKDVSKGLVFNNSNYNNNLNNSLYRYVDIITDDENLKNKVLAFISNIFVNEETFDLSINIISAVAEKQDSITHVGEENRRRDRANKIMMLNKNLSEIQNEKNDLINSLKVISEEADNFEREYNLLIELSFNYLNKGKRLEEEENVISNIKENITKINNYINSIEQEKTILENKMVNYLPQNTSEMGIFEELFNKLLYNTEKITGLSEQIKDFADLNDSLMDTISSYKIDLENCLRQKSAIESTLKDLSELMNNSDNRDKKEELEEINKRMDYITNRRESLIRDEGKKQTILEKLSTEITNLEDKYNMYSVSKEAKDKLLLQYRLEGIDDGDFPFNNSDTKSSLSSKLYDAVNFLKCLDGALYFIESKNHNNVSIDVNNQKICPELKSIKDSIENIYYLEYVEPINTTVTESKEAIKNLNTKYETLESICNEKHGDVMKDLFASKMVKRMGDIISESSLMAAEIVQMLEDQKQDKVTSFFLRYDEKTPSDKNEKTIFKLLKGKLSSLDENYKRLIDQLSDIVVSSLNANKNTDSIIDEIFQILDYKQFFEFNIEIQKQGSLNREKLTKKVFGGLSGGEGYRALAELSIALIKTSLKHAKLQNKMPLFAQIDEMGEKLDDIQMSRIEELLASSFDSIIGTSPSKYNVNSNYATGYIYLETIGEGDSAYILQRSKIKDEPVLIQDNIFDM